MNGLVLEELVRTVSGYGIDDVPSVTLSDEQSTLLKDQDSSQAELMAEKVILVDENDNIIGSDSKLIHITMLENCIVHFQFYSSIQKVNYCFKEEHWTK